MKIYTKTGDKGETSLIGKRTRKDDVRVEAYGTVDELNSFVQLAISKMTDELEDIYADFLEISHELLDCGHDLAVATEATPYKVKSDWTTRLETLIDKYNQETEPLKHFILPGGSELSSIVHICRTITRRAERKIVTLSYEDSMNDDVLTYINRLSDFFFVVARVVNKRLNVEDVIYKRSNKVFRSDK